MNWFLPGNLTIENVLQTLYRRRQRSKRKQTKKKLEWIQCQCNSSVIVRFTLRLRRRLLKTWHCQWHRKSRKRPVQRWILLRPGRPPLNHAQNRSLCDVSRRRSNPRRVRSSFLKESMQQLLTQSSFQFN